MKNKENMKFIKHIILIVVLGIVQSLNAQSDTTYFKFSDYMKVVKENHPIAMVADLNVEKGKANVRSNRGALIPLFFRR